MEQKIKFNEKTPDYELYKQVLQFVDKCEMTAEQKKLFKKIPGRFIAHMRDSVKVAELNPSKAKENYMRVKDQINYDLDAILIAGEKNNNEVAKINKDPIKALKNGFMLATENANKALNLNTLPKIKK